MKIAFITHDYVKNPLFGEMPQLGGTGLMRVKIPMKGLTDFGNHFTVSVPLAAEFLRFGKDGRIIVTDFDQEEHDDISHIVLQRWMSDEAPVVIAKAKAAGQVIINDIDDWFQGLTQRNGAFVNTHPKTNDRFNRNHYHKAIAAGSAITTSTQYLADRYESFGLPTFVLRNAIDGDVWSFESKPEPVREDGKLTVGWAGSTSQRTGADLEILKGVLPGLLEQHELAFHHSGWVMNAPSAANRIGIDETKVPTSQTPLTLIDHYPRAFRHFDIGVAPIQDIPFNRAKSWLKSLEMAAAGIPHVATDLPEYRDLGAGLLAKRPFHWRAALERLLDPTERDRVRQKGFAIAKKQTIQNRWQEWEDAYVAISQMSRQCA